MVDDPSQQSRQVASDWTAWLPDWGRLAVVVLERDTELSASLSAESRLLKQSELGHTGTDVLRQDFCHEPSLEFLSVSGTAAALQLIRDRVVVALVLNLESHCRESLVLLRQLLILPRCPELAAVGTVVHAELRTTLFEAGCPLLLTHQPYDVPLAHWLSRVILHRHTDAGEHSGNRSPLRG